MSLVNCINPFCPALFNVCSPSSTRLLPLIIITIIIILIILLIIILLLLYLLLYLLLLLYFTIKIFTDFDQVRLEIDQRTVALVGDSKVCTYG